MEALSSLLKNSVKTVREMVRSEGELLSVEMRASAKNVGKHSTQAGIFGVLLIASVLPVIAFLIIAIGRAMEGNYLASSLIVTVLFALVGGILAYRAFSKIKTQDINFNHSERGLKREINQVKEGLNDLKNSTQRRTT